MVNLILDFSLVLKFVFNREKSTKPTQLFVSTIDTCTRAIYVKVREEQVLEIILVVRKIIKSS